MTNIGEQPSLVAIETPVIEPGQVPGPHPPNLPGLEREQEPHEQIYFPDNAEVDEELSDSTTVVRTFRRELAGGTAEVMIASPRSGVLREAETSENAQTLNPLFLSLGINGDAKYPWTVKAFSKVDGSTDALTEPTTGRHVIGIRYPGKLKGTMKHVELDENNPDDDITVAELDKNQARDELDVLRELHVRRVDVVTESRGAIINTIAMDIARQEGLLSIFGDVINVSPAGQGQESYLRAHGGAALIAVQGLFRAVMLKEGIDPEARRLKGSGNIPGGRFGRDPLGWRREEVSVAKAKKANLHLVTARLAESMNALDNELRQSITHTHDPLDPAIRGRRLVRHNVGNVPIVKTDFKGHAIPYGRREPIQWIDRQFQEIRKQREHS